MRRPEEIRTLLFGVLLLAASLFAGCRSDEVAPVAQGPAPASEQRPSTPSVVAEEPPDAPLSVTILPPLPTASDDLKAVIHGSAVRCCFAWMINGTVLEGETSDQLARGSFRKGDEVSVRVEAGNGVAWSKVVIGNSPPQVTAVSLREARVHRGVDIELFPSGADLDDDPISYRFVWAVNGDELGWIDGPVLAGDRFRKGDRVTVRVIPFDAEGEGAPFAGEELVIPNAPPHFVTQPAMAFKGFLYSYEAKAEDPDGDELVYSLEAAPSGMSIDSRSGVVRWPVDQQSAGDHQVKVVVEDDEGMKAAQEYSLVITISE